jgi:hypothetical protein
MIALLEENQLLNPKLSKQEIYNLKKLEFTFNRMLKELAILQECIETNNLHLAEFKLSVGTRKVLKEIRENNQQISDISLLVEASTDPVSTADTSKNILSLINKFHTDNKQYLDNVDSDERLKDTSVPKNIGAEPSIIQKAALKTKELGGKAGQIAMTLFQSIVVNALNRFVNWSSALKSDILDAKKQGSAWQMIMTKLGPSMKIAKRAADGTITYESDSSGTSMLNKLQDFTKLNPKWTNTIIGLLINITKMLSISLTGATVGTSLVIGVLTGLLVRTIVGHYLKKESWKDALKNALLVTGLSLVGGALTKGLFSYFKGGGFIDGAKSYFTGVPGADISDQNITSGNIKVSEADITKLMVATRRGGDEKLLTIIKNTPELYKAFKEESESYPDIKTFIRFQDRSDLADIINGAGGIPKESLTKLATGIADTATQSYTDKPLKEIGKLALQGDNKAMDAYLQKFMATKSLGVDQYRILKKAMDAGIIDRNQFFSGVGPRTLNLTAELRGHIPISINGVSVIDKLTPNEAETAYTAMSMAKQMGDPVDEDVLAKLATKAGKSVTPTVQESAYKSIIKKLYI